MDEGECIHGISAEWCSICKHGITHSAQFLGAPFEAPFEGWCRGCRRPIDIGDDIRQVGDGRYGHLHCYPGSERR